jgi:hypothetical protein
MSDTKTLMAPRNFGRPKSNGDVLLWKNVKFAGRDADLFFSFYNDKLYTVLAVITVDKGNAFDTYNSIKDDMAAKYGEPTDNIEQYKYPYEKGDGHEETALYANAAKIFCRWVFDSGNYIYISLVYYKPSASNTIGISYVNKSIENEYLGKTKAANQEDL